jgi:hypothetical protein
LLVIACILLIGSYALNSTAFHATKRTVSNVMHCRDTVPGAYSTGNVDGKHNFISPTF